MTRVVVFGAGRMGRCLLDLAGEYADVEIVAQVARRPPAAAGERPKYFPTFEDAWDGLGGAVDLVIDFTLPGGTLAAARWCAQRRVALLSGVTGIGEEVHDALDKAAEFAPVLWAANLSFGINLMAGLLHELGKVIDRDTDAVIEETHHAGKKDAPSGTALFLARHIQPPAGGGEGTDPARIAKDFPNIDFRFRREGEVVGDHSVSFRMRDETLTLSHHAEDRRLFARGALEAGRWLARQAPGRYSAADWIRSMAAGEFR